MAIGRLHSRDGEAAPVRIAGAWVVAARARRALLLVCAWAASAGATEPKAWLDDMNRAFSELDYDGVFTYHTGGDMAALRVVHMVVDGERRERLTYLDGPFREIIRTGDTAVSVLSQDDELAELAGGIPTGPFTYAYSGAFDRVSDQYAVSRSGTGRIAGRKAVRISVTPRDGNRYGYRLWLDREHRMMLRSELIGSKGEKLEAFQFTSIAFGEDVDPADLRPSDDAGLHAMHFEIAAAVPAKLPVPRLQWRAGWVPAGFLIAAAEVLSSPAKPVETLMYTDGLASFSVFVEGRPEAVEIGRVVQRGATVAVSDQVPAPGGEAALVTLVGEVPEATARRVAASVSYGGDF